MINFKFSVIKDAMKIQNMSFPALAKLCDLSERTLKSLASGETNDPRISTILPPFRVLGLSIDRACGLAPERDMQKEAAAHEVSMVTALQERLAMQDAKLSEHRHTIMQQGATIAAQAARLEDRDASIARRDQQYARLEEEIKAERKSVRRMQIALVALIVAFTVLLVVYLWDVSNLHRGLTAVFNPDV